MARADQLERLLTSVSDWNRWRLSAGTTVDLAGAYLVDANLRGALLHSADLSNAHLAGANLFRARLEDAHLRGADLGRAQMLGTQLLGANLEAANLERASLVGAALSHARLRNARLADANLRRANLASADLRGASLDGANLAEANLERANLRTSSLARANLSRAIVTEADFAGSKVGYTTFAQLTLSEARGLADLTHVAPSGLDVDTLYRSLGLPPEFLLGCGLPRLFVEYLESFVGPTGIGFFPTFLSYSTRDEEFASRLYGDLIRSGVRVWMDRNQILPGDHLDDSITWAIAVQTDRLIFVCSEAALEGATSWWLDREHSRALKKEADYQKRTGKRGSVIVPVVIDEWLFSDDCTYSRAQDLRDRHAANFSDWRTNPEHYKQQLDRLVNALRTTPLRPGGFEQPDV